MGLKQFEMFTIAIANTDNSFSCGAEETVLAAQIRHAQVNIPIGCCSGGCGMCKVKVLRGCYRAGVMSTTKINNREHEEGVVLACRIIPESPLEILPLYRKRNLAFGFSNSNTV